MLVARGPQQSSNRTNRPGPWASTCPDLQPPVSPIPRAQEAGGEGQQEAPRVAFRVTW